jgi:alpha,alpha-trehalase
MSTWSLVYESYDPAREGTHEALCTLGNGYFCTRGAAPDCSDDGTHYPGTYVAGLYNRRTSLVSGREVENEDLVNLPNWLPLTFRIDGGPWFRLDEAWRSSTTARSSTCAPARCTAASPARRGGAAHALARAPPGLAWPRSTSPRIALETAEDWSGRLEVLSAIDGTRDQQQRRPLPQARAPAPRALGNRAPERGGDLAAHPDQPVAGRDRRGRPHAPLPRRRAARGRTR